MRELTSLATVTAGIQLLSFVTAKSAEAHHFAHRIVSSIFVHVHARRTVTTNESWWCIATSGGITTGQC